MIIVSRGLWRELSSQHQQVSFTVTTSANQHDADEAPDLGRPAKGRFYRQNKSGKQICFIINSSAEGREQLKGGNSPEASGRESKPALNVPLAASSLPTWRLLPAAVLQGRSLQTAAPKAARKSRVLPSEPVPNCEKARPVWAEAVTRASTSTSSWSQTEQIGGKPVRVDGEERGE